MAKANQTIKIGLGQINATVGDFEANSAKIISLIDDAERRSLDLVVFPEIAISGYPVWDLANKKQFVDCGLTSLKKIVAATRTKHVAVAVGFIDWAKTSGKSRNAIAIVQNGKIIHTQHKTLLPTYDVFLEQIFFEAETKHATFMLNGVRCGATICEDIWDDDYEIKPAKILADKGAKIIINISASPYHRSVSQTRHQLLQRKARDYGVWVVYVNQLGGQDDLVFDGRSCIYNENGKLHFSAEPFKEGLFDATIDFTRKTGIAYKPPRETLEMYEALCLGLSDYVKKNGFKRVAVGLSGGIDSALVATIACDALGKDSVVGIGMPGPFSSEGSLTDARALAKKLGIEFRVRPITRLYDAFILEAIQEKTARRVDNAEIQRITLAMENLQARLRGLTMMYLSNDESVLVLTTGNKSELAMGYCTLYGDMCGGLSVLGDVYKTDVYALARYRNSISSVIPEASISKPPSAELRPNQKDQDSLPPYEILDQILFRYIEKNEDAGQIIRSLAKKGASKDMVMRVVRSVDRNEYKRRQLPPLLRVTEKAWFGRRMPITNKFSNYSCSVL